MLETSKSDRSYRISNLKLEGQHRRLFGLMTTLQKLSKNPDRRFLTKILITLQEYMEIHFQDEERLMARMKFAGLKEHHRQHRRLILHIDEINKYYRFSNEDISEAVMEFLKLYFANHILIFDKAYDDHALALQKKSREPLRPEKTLTNLEMAFASERYPLCHFHLRNRPQILDST